MTLSLDVAERLAGLEFDALPAPAIHAAQLALADALCVMIAAAELEPAAAPFHRHASEGDPGDATLLAGGTAPPSLAVLANGALAHALDFEDTYDEAGLHPNAIVIPAALALAEAEKLTGRDLLLAIVSGCDIACRIGDALASDPASRGWYHPPIIAAAGAAFGVAHMLKLTPQQAVSAVSLTLCQFSLTDELKRSPMSDLRAVRDGFAARAVVEACLLARAGVHGTDAPLEGRSGLFRLLTGDDPSGDMLARHGTHFLGTRVTLKQWPCCRGTHASIALALALRDRGISPDDITGIAFTVRPPDDMLLDPIEDRRRPPTMVAAKFSIPFTFAVAMERGTVDLDCFGGTARGDERVLRLAAKAAFDGLLDPGSPDRPSARVTLRDGTVHRHDLPPAPVLRAGETAFEEMEAKFADCLAHAGRSGLLAPLLEEIRALPEESNLGGLTRLLRVDDAGA